MKIIALILLIVSAMLSGCVAPGSSIGRVGIKAYCESNGSSTSEMRAVLTKEYGLGGLDRYFGKPEDYGHSDVEKFAHQKDGRYLIDFPPVVYHISFWLLPPLGAFPKNPPIPVYWVQLSDSPDEVFLVGFDKDKFRYRVFDRISHREKNPTEARWLLAEGRYSPDSSSGGRPIWYLEFKLKKTGQGL